MSMLGTDVGASCRVPATSSISKSFLVDVPVGLGGDGEHSSGSRFGSRTGGSGTVRRSQPSPCPPALLLVDLPGRPVAVRLMKALLVVKIQPSANARPGIGDRSVGMQVGEWRGASQPRALPEPDVNLSIHPAPIIQPWLPGSSGRPGSG